MADHTQSSSDKRSYKKYYSRDMMNELNTTQKLTLRELEMFGWEIAFIRRPLFKPSIVVLVDGDRKIYVVLEPDGTLNEDHRMTIRPRAQPSDITS